MSNRIGHFRGHWQDSSTRRINAELLTLHGFSLCRPCQVWGTPDCNWYNKVLDIEVYNHNDSGKWVWVAYDRLAMVYESDLLKLLDWVKACRANEP
jgi:hypothetical protein